MYELEHDEKDAMAAQASPPPEPAPQEPTRAWVIAYGELGLINFVADSQEELAGRIKKWRETAAFTLTAALVPVEVINNAPEGGTSTIWIDPLQIQAVLEEFHPRPEQAAQPLELPPGLKALLDKAQVQAQTWAQAQEHEIAAAEVVVEEEKPGGEHD